MQRGVGNVFTNLHYPVVVLNLALQGRPADSLAGIGRFVVNSTVGIAGAFDIATEIGIPASRRISARPWRSGAGATAAT